MAVGTHPTHLDKSPFVVGTPRPGRRCFVGGEQTTAAAEC